MSKVKIVRSSVTGRFVPKSEAKRHPRTTETETIKRGQFYTFGFSVVPHCITLKAVKPDTGRGIVSQENRKHYKSFVQLNMVLKKLPPICTLCGRKKIFRRIMCPNGVCRDARDYGYKSWPPFCPTHGFNQFPYWKLKHNYQISNCVQ